MDVGIIGFPLRHSISPVFQQAAIDDLGLDITYNLWETPSSQLGDRVNSLRGKNILGANVTVPYKQAVIPYLDTLVGSAKILQSVNTIVNQNGLLEGHNTDVYGFITSLQEEKGFNCQGKNILVLGSGGVGRAVILTLADQIAERLLIANRTINKAETLLSELASVTPIEVCSLDEQHIKDASSPVSWDLIVNCTSIGMRYTDLETLSPISADIMRKGALVYDLVYNPPVTVLLKLATDAGLDTLGGLGMLIHQGAQAFRLWTNEDPNIPIMFQAARQAIY